MLQEVFRIPFTEISIYGYGLMMVVGFLAAVHLAKFLAPRVGIDPDLFINAGLIALVSGILGARMMHVIETIDEYTAAAGAWNNFLSIINIRSGGLTFYGGLLTAFPITALYLIWKKVPLRRAMDVVAPCIVLGLAFGRIGCFLNGCCYGAAINVPWAVQFPYHSTAYATEFYLGELDAPEPLTRTLPSGRIVLREMNEVRQDPALSAIAAHERSHPVHPTQIYSAITAFLIAGVLVAFFTVSVVPGRVMALMLMLEGSTRFILEMVRAEPAVLGPMSISMVIGAGLALTGVVLWYVLGTRSVRPPKKAPVPATQAS